MQPSKPKIILFGKNGQLGWEMNRCMQPLGEIIALQWPEIDFTQPDSLIELVTRLKPDLIVNAVAYTDVDKAESEENLADVINHQSPGALAQAARQIGAGLIHISTDYVFDGRKGTPYIENDPANPLNKYALGKLAGEQAVTRQTPAHWIIRTAWLYSLRQEDFVGRVLAWSRRQEVLRVVDDQVGSPTWARMLAEIITLALVPGKDNFNQYLTRTAGTYHLAGDGATSRYEWVKKILALDPRREEQVTREILPAKTSQFPTPARRPLFTALDCSRFVHTFGLCMPPWDVSLALAMETLLQQSF